MKHFSGLLAMIGCCSLILGCEKEPDFPTTPAISFETFSKNTVNGKILASSGGEVTDNVFLTFSFEDGDGDIGGNENFIFVKESIFDSELFFGINAIPGNQATRGVSGELSVRLNEFFCPAGTAVDTKIPVHFEVYIKDRNGNQSNTITTPSIDINCVRAN